MIRFISAVGITSASLLAAAAWGGAAMADSACTPWLYLDPVSGERSVQCLAASSDREPVQPASGHRRLVPIIGADEAQGARPSEFSVHPANATVRPGQGSGHGGVGRH